MSVSAIYFETAWLYLQAPTLANSQDPAHCMYYLLLIQRSRDT
jgi:hypothetical protein